MTTINGIDLLIAAVCLVVLTLIWVFGEKYLEWCDWDRDRRRSRRLARFDRQLKMEEEKYRKNLRTFLPIWSITIGFKSITRESLIAAEAMTALKHKLTR